jgi:hypothetical protein
MKEKLIKFIFKFSNFKKVKFFCVCGVLFLAKILLTWFFSLFSSVFYISYLLTHIFLFFLSFFFHTRITFNSGIKLNKFFLFLKAVLFLKLLDYFFVNVGVYVFDQHYVYSIVIMTAIIFVLRYFLFDKYVFKKVVPV